MNIRNTLIALLVMSSLTAISAEAAEPVAAAPVASLAQAAAAKPAVKHAHVVVRHHHAKARHGRIVGKSLAARKAGSASRAGVGKKVVMVKKGALSAKTEARKS